MRKLVAAGVGDRFAGQETFARSLIVQLGAGIGVGHGNLNRFAIEFLGEIDGLLDGFFRFAGKADDEIAVNANAHLLAVLHEVAAHLERLALLDVFQDLRVAGFKSHDQQAAAGIGHGFQRFVVAVDARRAGPLEADRLEFLAERQNAIFANVERVVVEEKFLGLRKHLVRLLEFARHVFHRPRAPGMAGKRLRPQAEGAKRRTSARRVEGNERMQQERHVVILDRQIVLVDVGRKRQRIELFGLHQRPRRVVDDFAVFHVAGVANLGERVCPAQIPPPRDRIRRAPRNRYPELASRLSAGLICTCGPTKAILISGFFSFMARAMRRSL